MFHVVMRREADRLKTANEPAKISLIHETSFTTTCATHKFEGSA